MSDATATNEFLGLAIAIYATLIGLFVWIARMMLSGHHPHLPERGRHGHTGLRR